jgi:hypothetical protein
MITITEWRERVRALFVCPNLRDYFHAWALNYVLWVGGFGWVMHRSGQGDRVAYARAGTTPP